MEHPMSRKPATVVFTIIFLFASFSYAAPTPKDSPAQDLYKKSGLSQQVEQLPALVKVGFDQAQEKENREGQSLPKAAYETITMAITGSFDPQLISRYLTRRIHDELTENEIREVLQWLDSPLGKKITSLEVASSTPEAYKEMQVALKSSQGSQSSPKRHSLIDGINQATKAVESSTNLAINMQIAVTAALVSALPSPHSPTMADIREVVERNRPHIEKEISGEVFQNALYTYRELTDAELEKYLAFIKSDVGVRYHEVVTKGLNDAMLECSKRSGDAIKRVVGGDPWEKIAEDIAKPLLPVPQNVYPQRNRK
jgi:hypothetical protein